MLCDADCKHVHVTMLSFRGVVMDRVVLVWCGVVSADLKWDKHIDIVTNKVSKNIGIIAKARHLLPQHLTRTLYLTALVDPYVSYCNLVWSLSHATTKLDRIYKLQKKILSSDHLFQLYGPF